MTQIAILGFGVVGSKVADLLTRNEEILFAKTGIRIHVKYILDLRSFPDHPMGDRVIRDYSVILNDPDVTIVCEMMGGSHPAYEYSLSALEAGKHVVTSNKEVVANYGCTLRDAAEKHGVRYLFEASVGGGIPVLRPMSECLAANRILSVAGILNGTTNYILTRMFSGGVSLEDALAEAQRLGYAERDPSADLEGIDACRKLCILSAVAFGKLPSPDTVSTTGISDITREDVSLAESADASIKLLGVVRLSDPDTPSSPLVLRVSPCAIPNEHPLASVRDVFNAITVSGDAVGDVLFYGRGAGGFPTADAVVGDLLDIISHGESYFAAPWKPLDAGGMLSPELSPERYLVRIRTEKPGTAREQLAAVADGPWLPSDESHLCFRTVPVCGKELKERGGKAGTIETCLPFYPSV